MRLRLPRRHSNALDNCASSWDHPDSGYDNSTARSDGVFDEHRLSDLLADSAVSLPGLPTNRAPRLCVPSDSKATNRLVHDHSTCDCAIAACSLPAGGLDHLLKKFQTEKLFGYRRPSPCPYDDVADSIEYDDCGAPVDGDQYNGHHSSGVFNGSPCNGGRGYDNNGRQDKGKQPRGDHSEGHVTVQETDSNATESSKGRFPCIFCGRYNRYDDPYSQCPDLKQYVSQLWSVSEQIVSTAQD